jgi:multidrug resistance efflux pump
MIAFFAIIYVGLAYLIFFQFKLLPFNLANKIATVVIGLLLVFGILIVVNFLHPMTMDVRVFNYVIQIAPRVPQAGRVTDVPVQPNVPVKKDAVLFQIDKRPYEYEVARLTAALNEAEQTVPQLNAALEGAKGNVERAHSQRDLAKSTYDRYTELKKANAGAVSDQQLEEYRRNIEAADQSLRIAKSTEDQATIAIDIGAQKTDETKAELAKAKLDLEETTVKAPTDGFVANLELKPGFIVRPGEAVMSFVSDPEGIVIATFPQEYLGNIAPGNEAEICLDMYPGKTLHGKVDTVIWASGQGQGAPTGLLPTLTHPEAAARYPVRILLSDADRQSHELPAGAGGAAAIYTDHVPSMQIVRRVVLRWYTWLNYIKVSM